MENNSIPCVCIDDENRPLIIPTNNWIIKGESYNITKIINMGMDKGVRLVELDLAGYHPFHTFKLKRFKFKEEHLPLLIEMLRSDINSKNDQVSEILKMLTIE